MYGKIFKQIYASSIAEDYLTRFVFMDLIVLADSDGVVDMTPEAIARATNVPLDIVNSAVNKLTQPDPRSRSKEENGARLRKLDDHRDWGWQIVNYEHYRAIRDEDERKLYMRSYMRNYRSKKKQALVNNVNSDKQALAQGSPSSYSSASGSSEGGLGETNPVNTVHSEHVNKSEPPKEVIIEFPDKLKTPRMMAKWGAWMNHRRAFKKPKSWVAMFNEQIRWLSQYDEPTAVSIITKSLMNGYQGLIEPKTPPINGHPVQRQMPLAANGQGNI